MKTIAKLSAYHEKTGGKSGEDLNLEQQFKKRFANMDFENTKDPAMRRLSMSVRRDTIANLAGRRDSFMHQRRVSMGGSNSFGSKPSLSDLGYDNRGYDDSNGRDSAMFDEDEQFHDNYSGSSRMSRARSSFEVSSQMS